MGARGLLLAITPEEREGLLAAQSDEERLDFIQKIEGRWEENFLAETDSAWDAIHRCLGMFPPETPEFYPNDHAKWALPEDHGDYPLKLAILGGRQVTDKEDFYTIRMVDPDAVPDIAEAMQSISRDELRRLYFHHCKGAWPEYGDEDFEYTFEWFEIVRDFYKRMSGNGRTIVFCVDQA